MPLKLDKFAFMIVFCSSLTSMNLAILADVILCLFNVKHANVCQCCQYSLMLLSICETAQQIDNNIYECLTAHSPQTCQSELHGFALVNPCLSIAGHFVSRQYSMCASSSQ